MTTRNEELPGARFEMAQLGFLLSEPPRAAILLSLMHGSSRPATELARLAAVSPQTASSHLARLTAGKLLTVEKHGRQRLYRLASAEVAAVLEAILTVAPAKTARLERMRADPRGEAFLAARTCYQHLARRLGVAIADALLREGSLRLRERQFLVTIKGRDRLRRFGVDDLVLRRPSSACLDCTERRPHIGAGLGTHLWRRFCQLAWMRPVGQGRVVHVTPRGTRELRRLLGALEY